VALLWTFRKKVSSVEFKLSILAGHVKPCGDGAKTQWREKYRWEACYGKI
jgi:hypothetical protein